MSNETTKTFADRLQDLIYDCPLTFDELSKQIGVSRASLSKYQNDNAEAGISALAKIARFFGVTTDYLLGFENCKTHDNTNINKETGLSDSAISSISKLLRDDKEFTRLSLLSDVSADNAKLLQGLDESCDKIKAPSEFDDADILNFLISRGVLTTLLTSAIDVLNSKLLHSVVPTDEEGRINLQARVDYDAYNAYERMAGFRAIYERSEFIDWRSKNTLANKLDRSLNRYLTENADKITFMDANTSREVADYTRIGVIAAALQDKYKLLRDMAVSIAAQNDNTEQFEELEANRLWEIISGSASEWAYVQWLNGVVEGRIEIGEH